jgi:ribosomal-protein-alanine N-acetyltransferase
MHGMFEPRDLTDRVVLRTLRPKDVAALTAAYQRNREHLARWEPKRSEEFFSRDWQTIDLANRLQTQQSGAGFAFGLFDGDVNVGRFNLAGVMRGPFQSAGLGYWVDAEYSGQGLASAAVRAIVEFARKDLGLHRIEASTLLHNVGSQRVLAKAGFEQIGMAPAYLQIAGQWQDHNLYQVVLHDLL